MLEEISAAVLFLTRLIEKGENFNHDQLEHFKLNLSEVLAERFENHWFPDKPYKGQGYRCIRVNGVNRRDPTLEKAARASGIKYEDMKLPCELTVWVDPNEVCCRFGEHKGSFCTLASFNDKDVSESSSGSEDSQGEDSIRMKHSPIPVTNGELTHVKSASRNNRNSSKGRKSSSQRGGGILRRGGGGGNAGFHHQQQHQHQLNNWYNVMTPPWLPPSPPPPLTTSSSYHSMLRAAAAAAAHHHHHHNHSHHQSTALSKWGPAHRYHWPSAPKSTLKV